MVNGERGAPPGSPPPFHVSLFTIHCRRLDLVVRPVRGQRLHHRHLLDLRGRRGLEALGRLDLEIDVPVMAGARRDQVTSAA